MRKITRLFICFGILLLAMTAKNAYADSFSINWTGGYGPGTAMLTATNEGGGLFMVTSITGTQNGMSISGLVPQLGYANNNYIYPSSNPLLDDYGLAFTVGSTEYNLFFNDISASPSVYAECSSAVTPCMSEAQVALSVPLTGFTMTEISTTGVPEPSSLLLVFAGLGALLGLSWRKRAAAESPAA